MNTTGMAAGSYNGQLTVTSPEASNSPMTVPTTLQVTARDTTWLSSTNVKPGLPFELDLRLHNLLPLDSVYLRVQFDNTYFTFDSVSEASRLASRMTLQVVGQQSLVLTQTLISSTNTVAQLGVGSGVIATLHFHARSSALEGEYQISCAAKLRDSLGVILEPPAAIGAVAVSGNTPVEPQPAADLPSEFHLYQNFPNPFNSGTVIYYELERGEDVTVEVLNIIGQTVRTLQSGYQPAGNYRITWDGRDDYAYSVGSGIYFVRLANGERAEYTKAVLLK